MLDRRLLIPVVGLSLLLATACGQPAEDAPPEPEEVLAETAEQAIEDGQPIEQSIEEALQAMERRLGAAGDEFERLSDEELTEDDRALQGEIERLEAELGELRASGEEATAAALEELRDGLDSLELRLEKIAAEREEQNGN